MKQKKKSKKAEESVQTQSPELDAEQVPSNVLDDSIHFTHEEKIMSRKFNFESLAVAEKKQSMQDEQNYQNLLREIAADKCTLSDEEVLEIVQRAGRDAKTLEEDAAERAERDRMIAELKRQPELQAKSDALTRQAKAMREEFEKVEAEYENRRNPVIWERNRIDATLREISDYDTKLFQSCPDTRLKIELDILENQWDDRAEQVLCERQSRIETEIRYAQQDLDRKIISPNRREEERCLKARIKELQNEFEEIETKKEELARKKTEHDALIAKHRELMIYA